MFDRLLKKHSVWKRFSLFLFIFSLSLSATIAQVAQGELIGEVRDAAGAGIAQATVTVTQEATGEEIVILTSKDGSYAITNLRPGRYTIAVSKPDFRRAIREGIQLTTGERIRVDLVLALGSVQEEVRISADASLLRTETSSLGQVIPNRRIVDLPLNGRNFFSLITLVPGVAAPPPTTAGPSFPRINGGRPRVNEYLYDGISALQPEPG